MTKDKLDPSHAAEARAFFSKPAGTAILMALNNSRPKMGGTTMEEKAMNAATAEGWEKCIDKLVELVDEQPTPQDFRNDKTLTFEETKNG